MARLSRPARSFDLHQHLTTLFVCAVATVLLTRALLAATGYPQVGSSSLHIAHVLYGGLLLLAALIATLGFLSPGVQPVAAVIGGVGFGLFIDEVGKFVTKNVNYFYRPAIAIIYVSFVCLFGVIRWLARRRFTAKEATLIAIDSLQRAATGTLTNERRTRVLRLLAEAGAAGPLVQSVRELLEGSAAEEERRTDADTAAVDAPCGRLECADASSPVSAGRLRRPDPRRLHLGGRGRMAPPEWARAADVQPEGVRAHDSRGRRSRS